MAKDGKKSTNKSKKKSATANGPAKKSRLKPEDNIAKSKKLTEKIKSGRCNSNLKSPRFINRTINDRTRVCENGKPMPSLSDLEKMFEDSDDDEEPKIVTQKENNSHLGSSSISSEQLTSPTTIKKIADRMMDMISNLPSINDYSPPIIPPKKRKKNKDIDEERLGKHNKRNKSDGRSESIIHSKSGDVALWLKDCEKSDHSDGSTDSNKTVDYDLSKSSCVNGRRQSFSPLPSTSRDRETITKNDQLFNESLLSEPATNENESILIINETKADTGTDLKLQPSNDDKSLKGNIVNATKIDDDIKIMENPCETIVIDDDIEISKPVKRKNIVENECSVYDCIEITEPDIKKGSLGLQDSEAIIIDDDDYYKSIDYSPIRHEITEVIDIDDIIAENKAIIKKYSVDNDINTVTCVDSTTISNLNNNEESKIELNSSNLKKKTNTVIINDDSSSTQNQDKLQVIVTNFFSNESNPEVETPKETGEVSVLRRFRDWLLSINSANAHNNTNNSPTKPAVTTPINLGSEHSTNAHFISRNTRNESIILIDDLSTPVNENSNQDGYQRCNKTHTTSMHSRRGGMHRGRHNKSHQHHTSNILSNQHYGASNTLYERCRKCHHSECPDRIKNRRNYSDNNHQDYNRSNIIPHTQPSLQQPTPVVTETAVIPPASPAKNFGDCPICMDSLAKNSVASTICGHLFCLKCIAAAFKTSGKRCPTCRKGLKKGGYHQIFL